MTLDWIDDRWHLDGRPIHAGAALLAILLLAAPAYGDTLIAEFRTTSSGGGILIPKMPATLPFTLQSNGVHWIDEVAPNQVGEVLTASASIVDVLRVPIATTSLGAGICAYDNCWASALDYWLSKPDNAAPFTHTFHDLVPNFRDYYLTGLTRTVESASITPFGSRWSFEGTQTIRFYGEFAGPQPGDFNQNFVVDAADYVLWRSRFTPPLGGDGQLPNESGQSDDWIAQEDYQFWRSQFGHDSIPSGSALLAGGSVPEPSSWLLFFFLLLSLGNSARR